MDIPLTLTIGARYSDDRKYGFNFLNFELPASGRGLSVVRAVLEELGTVDGQGRSYVASR